MITLRPYQSEGLAVDRQTAIANNLVHYNSMTPCKLGHIGLRYTKTSNCVLCMKLAYKPTGGKVGGKPDLNRQSAIQNNEKYYFTGKPCKHGHISKRLVDGSRCEECHVLHTKPKRKTKERGYGLKKNYGITVEQYELMLASQNSLCAICNEFEKSLTGKGDKLKPLAVDHCHTTGKIRGLLCSRCNIGIGSLKNNPDLLRKAALYCEAK